jgi:ABC-type phosphate transport system auxiliary subunit
LNEIELREALRVSESRVSQLQRGLENERSRRRSLEESGGEARLAELREENTRLMRSEEELMVLVLEMEGRIDKLMSVLNNDGKED